MPRKKSYQWQAGGNADNAEAPSRSAKKRQSLALQALGEELTRLSPAELQHLDLTPDLREALTLYARIRDHGGPPPTNAVYRPPDARNRCRAPARGPGTPGGTRPRQTPRASIRWSNGASASWPRPKRKWKACWKRCCGPCRTLTPFRRTGPRLRNCAAVSGKRGRPAPPAGNNGQNHAACIPRPVPDPGPRVGSSPRQSLTRDADYINICNTLAASNPAATG